MSRLPIAGQCAYAFGSRSERFRSICRALGVSLWYHSEGQSSKQERPRERPVSMVLQYTAKCVECGRVMRPGTEVDWLEDKGKYQYLHAGECPTDQPDRHTRLQNVARPDFDTETLLEARKCSQCGEVWTFMKGGARASTRTASCPSCGGGWLLVGQHRNHNGIETEGWAA